MVIKGSQVGYYSMISCEKKTKALTELTPEMGYDQMAMGLPPLTSTVFLSVRSF
jgi:hypothetical protein